MKTEMPYLFERYLVKAARELAPSASNVRSWDRMAPGIRAQLVDTTENELVQDFSLEGDQESTHILNAVSPGWTSSIPFADYIAQIVSDKVNKIS
jgi:L-2-hydroxyglutarate oxidase LhgO